MTYTNHTAGMTLATARDIFEHRPDAGWSTDQQARARAVLNHWARVRRTQARNANQGA